MYFRIDRHQAEADRFGRAGGGGGLPPPFKPPPCFCCIKTGSCFFQTCQPIFINISNFSCRAVAQLNACGYGSRGIFFVLNAWIFTILTVLGQFFKTKIKGKCQFWSI